MGAGGSASAYNNLQEAIEAGCTRAELLAHGVSAADIDFLTWNDDSPRGGRRAATPPHGNRSSSDSRSSGDPTPRCAEDRRTEHK